MHHPLGTLLTGVFRGDLKEVRGAWMEYGSIESCLGMESRTGESANLFVKGRHGDR